MKPCCFFVMRAPSFFVAPMMLVLVLLGRFAPQLAAQDVTVIGPELLQFNANVADTPPVLKKKPRPVFPDVLKRKSESGYAFYTASVDETGALWGVEWHGTNGLYEESFKSVLSDARYAPAKKDGQPVRSIVWAAAIFNSASAQPNGRDAEARLLKVTPILISQKQREALPGDNPVVRVVLTVDTDGVVQKVVLEDNRPVVQEVLPNIEMALKQWKFSPARNAGQAIESLVRMGVILQQSYDNLDNRFGNKIASESAKMVMPKAKFRTAPIYPRNMISSRMVGAVLISFIVDETGSVKNPEVVKSNNPGFEQAAIDAVLQWKFVPGTKDGKPVNMRMQIPIAFQLDDDFDAKTAYTEPTPSKKEVESMPEGLRFDVSPKVRNTIFPVYPYEKLRDGGEGKATIALLIDAQGQVRHVQVIEASAPEFGLAYSAACEYFEFTPAMLEGRPTKAVIKVEIDFSNVSSIVTNDDRDLLRLEKKSPEKIIPAKKLDAMPKLIVKREPKFPVVAMNDNQTSGQAVVEFLIDSEGRVRLPRIISCTHPSFGYMAVQTVANWRFEPPMCGGKSCVTKARLPMSFATKSTSANK